VRDTFLVKFDDELFPPGKGEELSSTLQSFRMKDLSGLHSLVSGDDVRNHSVKELSYRRHGVVLTTG
jgi:hypothetical protein